jgi:hypothetical protein
VLPVECATRRSHVLQMPDRLLDVYPWNHRAVRVRIRSRSAMDNRQLVLAAKGFASPIIARWFRATSWFGYLPRPETACVPGLRWIISRFDGWVGRAVPMSRCCGAAAFLMACRRQGVTVMALPGRGVPRIWLTLAIGNVSGAVKECARKLVIRSPVEILHVLDGAVGKPVHEQARSTPAARGARPRILLEPTSPHSKTGRKVVTIA